MSPCREVCLSFVRFDSENNETLHSQALDAKIKIKTPAHKRKEAKL